MKIQFLASFVPGVAPEGDAWKIVFIDEGETAGRGWGIWAQGLEASMGKFHDVWVQEFRFDGGELNHLPEDVRAVFPTGVISGNIVGMAGNPQLEVLGGKQALTGMFRPASDKINTLLTMAREAGKLDEFGLSINGEVRDPNHLSYRTLANRRKVQEVLLIDELYSVDLVSHPGRGGGFLDMLASAGLMQPSAQEPFSADNEGDKNMKDERKEQSAVVDLALAGAEDTPENIEVKASEKMDESDRKDESVKKDVAEKQEVRASFGVSDLERRMLQTDTRLRVRMALEAESDLRPATRRLIAGRLDGEVLSDEEISTEIKGYKDLFAAENPDNGKAIGVRASGAAVGASPADKVQQAADQMCGVKPQLFKDALRKLEECQGYPREKFIETFGLRASSEAPSHYDYSSMGLRDLYIHCTGDREISFNFRSPRNRSLLAAAITESTPFGDALGTSLNRRLLQDWMMKELGWRKIATIKPGGFSDFRPQTIVTPGGVGELATVADDGVYQEISLPTDDGESYTPLTKGNLLPITRRAVLRDDVGLVNRMITSLRRGAQHTFNKAFFYKLAGWETAAVNDYVMADTYVIYESAHHGNIVAGVYTYANLKAAKLLMRQQTEKDSGIWLNLTPRYHVVPVSYEDDGLIYITSPNVPGDVINDVNTVRLNEADVIVVDDSLLGGSATYAYLVADPMDYESLEVAFLMDQQVPELFVQNDPTVGDSFKQDRFTWKIRFEFGIGIGDYRGLVRLGA